MVEVESDCSQYTGCNDIRLTSFVTSCSGCLNSFIATRKRPPHNQKTSVQMHSFWGRISQQSTACCTCTGEKYLTAFNLPFNNPCKNMGRGLAKGQIEITNATSSSSLGTLHFFLYRIDCVGSLLCTAFLSQILTQESAKCCDVTHAKKMTASK